MVQLNKFHIAVAFIFLAALRIAIGFHFFDQGHQKIRKGGFDSTGFLKAADGPFAPLFHSMVPDYDGKIRLCYDKDKDNLINPDRTIKIWEQYKNFIIDELIKEEKRLAEPRQKLKDQLDALDPASEEYLIVKSQYNREEEVILAIRESRRLGTANKIFEDYKNQLIQFFDSYEEDINFYFLGEKRLDGFQRDLDSSVSAKGGTSERGGAARMRKAAANVSLLKYQVDTIESDRKKEAASWLATVDGLWEGLEFELLNMVPLSDDRKAELQLALPTESETVSLINRVVPYFDMTVGLLLILGLFTRTASLAAGCFLISILMTQAAILGEGAYPTAILYLIEMLAAFTIFATCAGRYAGLDYFIHSGIKRLFKPETEDLV